MIQQVLAEQGVSVLLYKYKEIIDKLTKKSIMVRRIYTMYDME